MKTGRTLSDLAAEIDRQAKAKQDFIAPTPKLTLVPGLEPQTMDLMVENGGLFPVRDLALSQIGERTGVPMKYLRRMRDEAPDLLSTNVNYWFR